MSQNQLPADGLSASARNSNRETVKAVLANVSADARAILDRIIAGDERSLEVDARELLWDVQHLQRLLKREPPKADGESTNADLAAKREGKR